MARETVAATETLRLYRSDHRIKVRLAADLYERCETDGIRVWPMKNGRYRHDPSDVVKLIERAYAGPPWEEQERMDRAAVEVARDMIREDFTPIERVLASVPEDLDEDEDMDGWRERQPEFNGSFR